MPLEASKRSFLLIAGLLVFSSLMSFAQTNQETLMNLSPRGSTTNYQFAEANELTIVVNLIGEVQHPGRYELSRTIDLPSLLSLAGGTTESADITDIRIMRTTKVGDRLQRQELRVDLNEILRDPDAELLLNQGDFVTVGESSWTSWRDVFSLLTTAAVITTAIVSVISITED